MLASNVWTFLLALSFAVVQGEPEPPWFQRISATFDGVNLQKCSRRPKAPENNTRCSKIPKTCFFGNQDCPGVGPHPVTKCACSSRIWKCEAETCPVVKANDALPNGCTADGVADLSSNDPLCPVAGPLDGGDPSSGCVPALYGKSCAYGSEKCCGQCHPNYISTCDSSGEWFSFFTDACLFPSCQRIPITGLEGKTCAEATSEILKLYPGIKVLCVKETDPLPTDDNFERYLVITDANGKVLQVVFNKVVACPAESPVTTELSFCESPGQVCSYVYESNPIPNAKCEASDSCTCNFGSWLCSSGIACVGGEIQPPVLTVCPETSPLVSNNTTCDAAAGPCTFIYKSKIPGATCESTDTCTCTGGQWKCDSVVGCVPDEAPFIIGCPEASPALGNVTVCDAAHQESPCTFKYSSTIPGGICQNTDTCGCNSTTSIWDCERSIGCVSANPPFIIGCPAESPVVSKVNACDAQHQEQPCSFNYGSTFPGAICQNADICTCNSTTALWDCQSSIGCVSDNPPFIIGCPLESPVVSNVTSCDAQHQEQPCAFKYGSTIPGGICQNADICSCNSTTSLWNCEVSIGCVSDNPPFIIGCPLESPVVSNVTSCDAQHPEQPCSFNYGSTIPGGICGNTDMCTCNSTTALWDCQSLIACVSDNPTFIIACPAESPVVSNVTVCDAAHQEQPCTFKYGSTIPGGICENTDICTCNGTTALWNCDSLIGCVSDNPPVATFRIACPVESPLVSNTTTCDAEHQDHPCSFGYPSTIPGGICQTVDICSCNSTTGLWNCDSSIGCVSADPPFIIGCPAESPVVGNVTVCDAAHQEQPCSFKYSSTIPGGICGNTDICTCNNVTALWNCESLIGCVSDNPPFIIGCPSEPPANGTVCDAQHQEQPCGFVYNSTIPGGICENKDLCTCDSPGGLWVCDKAIACVSDNPPSIGSGVRD
ncbi:hypothetical protein MHU86_24926 [Fragilaria crotonensis]|nr:hypothetical protein MHU86_24926 [Fragilaria crotonensis]